MTRSIRIFLMLLALVSLSVIGSGPLTVYAAVPHLINYQGRVTDTSGNPLSGSYDITFRIYDAESAGNLLWEETQAGVVIDKGLFGILLGSVTPLDIPFDKAYFLEIKVGTEVMSPRQRITSAGYAIRAERAEQANNADTVSGVGLSATPAPNKLLPLDGGGKLPAGQGLLGNNIVILTGTISSGGTIPLPAGYTQDQCIWMVGGGAMNFSDDQHATLFYWEFSANASRLVTVTYRGRSGGGFGAYQSAGAGSYANYIIIGVK